MTTRVNTLRLYLQRKGGISFSGITQLFTAGTQPPHLAAIAPMSVTDDTYTATGYPGGINNSGFALSWVEERMSDAVPAPEGGQPWAKALVAAGDQNCIANQKLRLQTRDAVKVINDNIQQTLQFFEDQAARKKALAGTDAPAVFRALWCIFKYNFLQRE